MDSRLWDWLRVADDGARGSDGGPGHRICTDGGNDTGNADGGESEADEEDDDGSEAGSAGDRNLDRSNVEVNEAGASEPADPKWEKPDPEDIPEFEVRADEPTTVGGETTAGGDDAHGSEQGGDPTEGMPNTARAPGDSRISSEGTEGYVAALELAARLPEDAHLPAEAADLVPAAVEAELEQDVQSFAAAEFDNQSPHVDVLEFVERDGDVWLRLRLGIPADAFEDLDPGEVRAHALQELEGLL